MPTMRRRVGTFGTGMASGARGTMLLLARVVSLITMIVVGIIVIGILLVVLNANMSNDIVSTIHDWANWLVGPFKDLFSLKGDKNVVVNWGVAAIVYAIVGSFIARLLRR